MHKIILALGLIALPLTAHAMGAKPSSDQEISQDDYGLLTNDYLGLDARYRAQSTTFQTAHAADLDKANKAQVAAKLSSTKTTFNSNKALYTLSRNAICDAITGGCPAYPMPGNYTPSK